MKPLYSDRSSQQPSALDVLTARAEARAYLWANGEIATIPEVVDALQEFAEKSGLVLEIGQDAVQEILSAAFTPFREVEWAAQAQFDELEDREADNAALLYCDRCGSNPSFCGACRADDEPKRGRAPNKRAEFRPAQSLIDAFKYLVKEGDQDRLRAWVAARSADESEFFRTMVAS
jgi:hypothetical protein